MQLFSYGSEQTETLSVGLLHIGDKEFVSPHITNNSYILHLVTLSVTLTAI